MGKREVKILAYCTALFNNQDKKEGDVVYRVRVRTIHNLSYNRKNEENLPLERAVKVLQGSM